ncbi:MAG: enolase C-terminal domain-like protein [Candidatus Dormibacteria bacterium]
MSGDFVVDSVDIRVYTVPTEQPEADGTLQWDATSYVVVQPHLRNGTVGLGYAVADLSTGHLARSTLADVVVGMDVRDSTACWEAMVRRIRNLGRPGIASMAIAALDIALWDTKARAVALPLHRLLGSVRDSVPIYGSGGFTTYTERELCAQLAGWVEQGIPRVKMKIGKDRGRSWEEDVVRVRAARNAIGTDTELFVDANGAYDLKQALRLGRLYAEELGVAWFEEPVTSDDLDGLRQLRESLPLDVTAGEYGYHLEYFRNMLEARSVDVLQADVGRCAGITEWLRVASTSAAFKVPYSAHCGPSIHVHPATVPPNLRHIEYFHDHVRVDQLLFDGVLEPQRGRLKPADDRPGLGLALKLTDAEPFRVL